jgi:hypothetical protein
MGVEYAQRWCVGFSPSGSEMVNGDVFHIENVKKKDGTNEATPSQNKEAD